MLNHFSSKMYLTQLSIKILEKINANKEISRSDWSSDFYLESEINAAIKSLERFTNKEGFFFKKEQGPVGWEYGLSVLLFIDKLYLSPPITGNYSQVTMGHTYKANPEYKDNNKKVLFEIEIDSKKYKSKIYETEKIREKIMHGFIISLHTHPKYYHDKSTSQYTFFSSQDISSLLYGRSPMLGLIAGNHLWIACRTSESQMIPPQILQTATRIELQNGINGVEEYIRDAMKEYGVIFYSGKVGGKMRKIA